MTLLNYHFFAEVFQPSGEAGGSAELVDPRGTAIAFARMETSLPQGGDHEFRSLAELNGKYPTDDYTAPLLQAGAPVLSPRSG